MNWTKEDLKDLGLVRVTVKDGSLRGPIPCQSHFESREILVTRAQGIDCYLETPGVYDEGSVVWGPIGVLQSVTVTRTPAVGDTWMGQDKYQPEIKGEFRIVFISESVDEVTKYLVVTKVDGCDASNWVTLEGLEEMGYQIEINTERRFIRVEDLPKR